MARAYQPQVDLSAGVVAAMSAVHGGTEGAPEAQCLLDPRFSVGKPIGALAPAASPLAVILLGPTGSGKTALSLALGERFGGEDCQLRLGGRLPRHGAGHGQTNHRRAGAGAAPFDRCDDAGPAIHGG